MFDDQTEIRHTSADKQLWRAAAKKKGNGNKLSPWIRDTLNAQARLILFPPDDAR